MGEIADRFEALVVEARSPDGRIKATLKGRNNISLRFASDSYLRYEPRELENQLAKVATLTWTSYRRAYDEICTSAGLEVVAEPGDDWNPADVKYREERLAVEGRGKSISEAVKVRTLALLRWQVKIADGALSNLTEVEFIREVLSATSLAIVDYRRQSSIMRARHFGTFVENLP